MVSVGVISEAGHQVLVVRHRMSRFYIQSAFAGGGIEYAENLINDNKAGKPFRFDERDVVNTADYTGLECRWDNVFSEHGETISLIVKVLSTSIETQEETYKEIIKTIRRIYGDDEICRPVQAKALHLTNNNSKLSYELKVRTFMHGIKNLIIYWLSMRIQNILGWIFMTFSFRTGDVYWGNYKNDLVSNTDFKKFDGMLREVIFGKAE